MRRIEYLKKESCWHFFKPITFEIMKWRSYSGGIGYDAFSK